jgi:hypothetical protein
LASDDNTTPTWKLTLAGEAVRRSLFFLSKDPRVMMLDMTHQPPNAAPFFGSFFGPGGAACRRIKKPLITMNAPGHGLVAAQRTIYSSQQGGDL